MRLAGMLILLLAAPSLAETVARPMPRPVAVAPVAVAPLAQAGIMPRPRPRPSGIAFSTPVIAPVEVPALIGEVAPKPRPKGLGLFRTAAKPKPDKAASKSGSVCGDPSIRGQVIAPIVARVTGCGISEPVAVSAVSGVRLSQVATMDCPTAKALSDWVDTGLQPAFGTAEVVELRVAAHYVCRPRNNVKGAKISEHGRGKAIDISGFVLDTGKMVSVSGDFGKAMRRAHKAACGIFGTTLGPGSDGYHEDNLHYDTARYRGGPYCR